MSTCDTCHDHDRPEVALAAAMADARALAGLIRGDCAALLDDRICGVARTVAAMADARAIVGDRYLGPLSGLIDGLDRRIAASLRPVAHERIVGADETGPIVAMDTRHLPDPGLAPIVALRDRARALLGAIECVRDAIAADEAVMRMRRGAAA